jgi:hypothetical protein
VLFQNPVFAHAVDLPTENVIYGNLHPPNVGFTVAFGRLDGNAQMN